MSERQLSFHDKHSDFEQSLKNIKANRHPLSILCDHLDDIQNIGGLFRLADAANLKELIFYNNQPFELTKKLHRISRQTVDYVSYRIISNLQELDKSNHQIIALEYTNKSIAYTNFLPEKPVTLVLGNEKYGVSEELLNFVERSIHIPMFGVNNSMNVTNAAGIVVYGLLNQKKR